MRKIVLAIVALAIGASAMAQDTEKKARELKTVDKTEMLKARTAQTVDKLGLNKEQAEKLLHLNTKYADKMRPTMRLHGQHQQGRRTALNGQRPARLHQDSLQRKEMTPEIRIEQNEIRQQMKANKEAYEAELKTFLTEEQFKAYKADEEQMRMRGMRPGSRRDKRDDKVETDK
ncbi:MAG: DUF4890 domain-containing protein [Prevotella sp.]|nr:DUF4890 domain-containing protein [Prevotella sp.]